MSSSIAANSGRNTLRRAKSKPASASKSTTDPLSIALQPPSNETSAERSARLLAEKQAKAHSDEIDKLLRTTDLAALPAHVALPTSEGRASSKKGRVYKMVLLGQAGAGKTTILKQMRLLYDPAAHEHERRGWIRIVLLNLTNSVRVLLQTLDRYHEERADRKSLEFSRLESPAALGDVVSGENAADISIVVRSAIKDDDMKTNGFPCKEHIPSLVELERMLRAELGAFGEEIVVPASGASVITSATLTKNRDKSPLLLKPGWQERLFAYARRSFSASQPPQSSSSTSSDPETKVSTHNTSRSEYDDENNFALSLLRSIQPSVLALWNTNAVVRALRKRGFFLDSQNDSATSFFLDCYTRITSPGYIPSDEDILHSRVRTLGVTEEFFRVERSLIYRIYDVGGSRSQRTAWAPFLDDVDAIIFLAPLSAFDQPLVEDPATNRLADTFALFNQIVSNPLLKKATVILFLNKIDLLEKKLKGGVRLNRYWGEYDGDNDFEAVWRWFRGKFRDCVRMAEDEIEPGGNRGEGGGRTKRRLYVHTTIATSTKQIRAILMSVKDCILRENLKITGLVS
ncbi:probable guanine nucleotide-binding protein alpha-4 subunit [Melanopsichium pennsylvanicum]|uniref:Guanine nucleotide-binding protein alpha-4 subunit n=2 Tax=Melanopsichium pennsylvanicum TaxID=63383 RepID=A0A077RA74_9BASI|nr:guanine nucleotide-binding protein alpha-4 subunit [Melanopsichium pennsylvanicum 4]SNX87471.1 probable guanine nucleotide-binding protein alpha-4 subunit [Melanopsichium pennsylvanicum]